MAIRLSSPWLTALLCVGLLILFMGERAFAHTGFAGQLAWLGSLLIALAIGARGWALIRTQGAARNIELVSVVCNFGVLLGLLGYYLTTDSGMALLGIESATSMQRWQMTMQVLWVIVLVSSITPMILVDLALGRGAAPASPSQGATVNLLAVREMASSGLSIALAASFLMVTCNIADQRNIRKDVSYFKTSSPGSATINMLEGLNTPLRVITFFPQSNAVGVEVEQYFKALASKSSNLQHESRDQLIDAALVKEFKVSKQGTIVLVRGDTSEKFTVSVDYQRARNKHLREFDGKFQKSLMAVLRDPYIAYFSVGHGELNDPGSSGSITGETPSFKTRLIKSALSQLNFKVKDYQGYGKPVPEDCTVLFVLAPQSALLEEELLAIDAYLAKGGAAILAMDPDAGMRLGPLQERLGVRFDPAPVLDDKEFVVQSRTAADHSWILTNQFLSHASISKMGRGKANAGILFVKPGSFEEIKWPEDRKATKRSKIIRSMPTAFRDLGALAERNLRFDAATEKRERYAIVMAVENSELRPADLPEGSAHSGMRVILLGDRDVLSDRRLNRVPVAQNMVVDIIKWTSGEEAYSGETTSEKDTKIAHTKNQDAVWFYSTILAAPLLLLGLGLLYVRRRRQHTSARSES